MQLFPILLIVIVLAADGGVRIALPAGHHLSHWAVAAIACLIPLGIVAVAWLMITMCDRRLSHGKAAALGTAERTMRFARAMLLVHHAVVVFVFGWLDVVRGAVGDLILIDELLAIGPPLLGLLGLWWAYYPIERRIRDTLLIRRLDLGKPIYPAPSRQQYVMLQARAGLMLVLAPIVMILGIAETIHFTAFRWADPAVAMTIANTGTVLAAASVFVAAPLMMRWLLNVKPIPAGPMREELLAVCTTHDVRVRELLLWNTNGTMINAAVMGLFGRVRYVLVTDALIETMTMEQLKAVMAHEVGHVRRHHMPWMVLVFIAVLLGVVLAIEAPLLAMQAAGFTMHVSAGGVMTIAIMAGQLVLALLLFGWASRRFERQADTFAVQHLSGHGDAVIEASGSPLRVSLDAVDAMRGALDVIAHLNAVDARRPSWRHGSIAWRQAYLASLVGQPVNALPIDRLIKHIKRGALVILIIAAVIWWL